MFFARRSSYGLYRGVVGASMRQPQIFMDFAASTEIDFHKTWETTMIENRSTLKFDERDSRI